ncbi:hypothetical protein Scep_006287 [Stephania cephalantha]|uniref:Uncharacterized protein n=1 Tax=Stephania cephalantha TaxID=152367 RepID=A0AAP0K8X5_9MAGN
MVPCSRVPLHVAKEQRRQINIHIEMPTEFFPVGQNMVSDVVVFRLAMHIDSLPVS